MWLKLATVCSCSFSLAQHACTCTSVYTDLLHIRRDNDLKPILISVGIQARKKSIAIPSLGEENENELVFFFLCSRQIIQWPLCLNTIHVAENLALLLKSKRSRGLCVLELRSRACARHARFASSARVVLLRLEECMGNGGLPQHPVSIMSFGPLPQERRNFILHL